MVIKVKHKTPNKATPFIWKTFSGYNNPVLDPETCFWKVEVNYKYEAKEDAIVIPFNIGTGVRLYKFDYVNKYFLSISIF